MIPDIGFIIGFYVITRCVNMISKKETRTLSWITIGITILCLLDLIGKGAK